MTNPDNISRPLVSPSAGIVVEPVDACLNIDDAIVSFSRATRPVILESSLHKGPYARFTILASDPISRFLHRRNDAGCPFRILETLATQYPSVMPDPSIPFFAGGWIGHFSYEAGLKIEGISCRTQSDIGLPLASFGLYDAAAVFDHESHQWFAVAVDWPCSHAIRRSATSDRLNSIKRQLVPAANFEGPRGIPHDEPSAVRIVRSNMTDRQYLQKVGTAKRYIEAGDIFQVNLTRRFTTRTLASPIESYLRLREISPSSHAAFLLDDRYAIMSSSPELFLDVCRGRTITRPIKGTRPRRGDPATDELALQELATSEKERAELNMIIDLMRNDLGRVCRLGSVRVESDGDIETHPTVYHRVATVSGDLAENQTVFDLLRATMPGGSITGAPKIRAMQIINELEPTERGVYCGSIGYIGLDGSMSMNIAIRTMVQQQHDIHMFAGGAVVADSDPQSEHEEVLAKARGMFDATGSRHQDQIEHEALAVK